MLRSCRWQQAECLAAIWCGAGAIRSQGANRSGQRGWNAQPAGSRVKSVMIGDQPLDDNQAYTLATNDVMAKGGDGYEGLNVLPVALDHANCPDPHLVGRARAAWDRAVKLGEALKGAPQEALKEHFSALEEGRADLVALYFLADPKLAENLEPGDRIRFGFKPEGRGLVIHELALTGVKP